MAKVDVDKVYEDMDLSLRYLSKTFKAMKKDFEYALGRQWSEDDIETLRKRGVKALTINKIKPMIKLVTGIERQSRSDFKAFPEGTEDVLLSEIATRLLKNTSKQSRLKNKTSEQFKEGMICGASYIEPFIDYTYDLINGEIKFRKIEAKQVLFDPNCQEYDLSDGKFLIKLTLGLSEEDVEFLFPDKKKKIEGLGNSKIDMSMQDSDIKQALDYPMAYNADVSSIKGDEGKSFDLIEYYYKSPMLIYYVISKTKGVLAETENKEEADMTALQNSVSGLSDVSIVTKKTYEIRLKQVIGKTEFSDERASTFPRWKSYPIVPFFADRMTVDVDECDLLIQGIVRSLCDLQDEYNKRRTQELQHLNSNINSGMFIPKDALDDKNKDNLTRFGATPGVKIYYDPEKTGGVSPVSWRVSPAPLSQGHAQLAQENAQDIKEASGVNPDLLANDSESQSGRAILLKQRQGLVMVQESLDNYQQTKEILGRFILSQLGEIYTLETAMQVLGDGFLKDNFKRPIIGIDGMPVMRPDGTLETEFDEQMARLVITKVLSDTSIGKYDVTIGEGTFNETIQMTNFASLMEMAKGGIPIPPDVIVSESMLSSAQKEKIIEAITKMQSVPQGGMPQ